MWASVKVMPIRKDKWIHVHRYRNSNDFSWPSSLGMEPVSWLVSAQMNGKEMWASVKVMPIRQDKRIHVRSSSNCNDFSWPSSLGMEPVSSLVSVQIEWQGNVSKCESHANKRNQTNTRTERQGSQRGQLTEFAWNGTSEFIIIWSNEWQENVSKCESHANKTRQTNPRT